MAVDTNLNSYRHAIGGSNGSAKAGAGTQSLAAAIQLANRSIYEAGNGETGRAGMGSTIVAALVRGSSLAIGHVGDSRIYVVRQGVIQQLTEDHSWVMEQVRHGFGDAQEALRGGGGFVC